MSEPKLNLPTVDLGGDVQKFINDVVDTGKKAVSDTSNFINRSGDQFTIGVRDGIAGAAKNFERNAAAKFNNIGRAFKGDFTGFDRTLIDAATTGLMAFANPDDISTITGTTPGQEQLNLRAEQQAQAQAAADAAAKEAERLAGIRDVITGQVAARARAPGRGMVFSAGGGSSDAYTLLTPAGK